MIYNSIVNSDILNEFSCQNGVTLMNHVANSCSIEEFIAVAGVLCPEIIEINGCIFLKELYHNNIDQLQLEFYNDRMKIEQFVNTWSLGDFFIESYTESVENEKIINQFGILLVYFWDRRFKELFPNKSFIVKLVENLTGENGVAITVYQT